MAGAAAAAAAMASSAAIFAKTKGTRKSDTTMLAIAPVTKRVVSVGTLMSIIRKVIAPPFVGLVVAKTRGVPSGISTKGL
jgi:hypothetical protein